jgi:hypothetical protein
MGGMWVGDQGQLGLTQRIGHIAGRIAGEPCE